MIDTIINKKIGRLGSIDRVDRLANVLRNVESASEGICIDGEPIYPVKKQ